MPVATLESMLIDAAELARLLAVSKPTIWRLREAGKLPPAIALTSQCVRWQRDRVLAWIDDGCPAGGTVLPKADEPDASSRTVDGDKIDRHFGKLAGAISRT